MGGTSDAFASKAGLCGQYQPGAARDLELAQESAGILTQTPMFRRTKTDTLVHLAAAMSAYLCLKQFEDLAVA